MIEFDLWDIIKTVVLVPLGWGGVSVYKDYSKQKRRIDSLGTRVTKLEVMVPSELAARIAKIETKLDNVTEDNKEIKEGVDKLISRLIDKNKG